MGVNIDEEGIVIPYGDEDGDAHPDAPVNETTLLHPADLDSDDSDLTPRFLQDEGAYRHFRWVPSPVRRFGRKVRLFMKGPQPPKRHIVRPIFPYIQEAPMRFMDQFFPKKIHRFLLLLVVYSCWIVTFGIVFWQSRLATDVEGYGSPSQLSGAAAFFVAGNGCGLHGNNCRPFNGTSFAFRCPANSAAVKVLNPRAVGAQEIVYRQLVIGGPSEEDPDAMPIYRGDSFICGAAIHAGIIDNASGGCGIVSLVGEHRNYESSRRHGITSIAFDSYFPQSFTFLPDVQCKAKDLRWSLLAISVVYSSILSLFTTSPAVFYFTSFVGVFWHVGFASDPPPHTTVADLFSDIIGKFLPAAFCAFVMYRYAGRRTLTGLTAQIEKTVLWLGACWFGALSNYSFRFIPIQRLNAHDLQQQPGAILALVIIVLILACIVVKQALYFRIEGRLPRYLALYVAFVAAILLSLLIPGVSLRIHHYFLGLLLMPGTSMQTRPSLLYQGLLMGFFCNGIARWGFDAILQTPGALRGDAKLGSLLPQIMDPVISLGMVASNITFSWPPPPEPYNGVSVLVNDVEKFRGYTDEGTGSDQHFVWERDAGLAEPEYFRFGYLQDTMTWDFTKAGIWKPDGSWVNMEPGPSKVRVRDLDSERFTFE